MTSIVLESCFNVSAARVSLLKFTERFDAGAADYNFYYFLDALERCFSQAKLLFSWKAV